MPANKRAADLLAESLVAHGVDRVFCVPGESYLPVLDALVDHPSVDVVVARHEGGAGFMGIADAKLTERPGVVFVSRGPGATNTSIAVHSAQQDAVPMVFFIGQIERKDLGRKAFQEVDYVRFFGDMAKHVVQIDDPERVSELTAIAFQQAMAGTPGPAVVVLPEDMLFEEVEATCVPPRVVSTPRASDTEIAAVAERIAAAERPLVIAGGLMRGERARAALLKLAETWSLPVAVSSKQQDIFPNAHPNFAGHMGYMIPEPQLKLLAEADLVIGLGSRLGDVTSQGYRLPKAPVPDQPLIHVYPDAAEVGRVFAADMALAVDPVALTEGLAARNAPPPPEGRAAWIARPHAKWAEMQKWEPVEPADGVSFGTVVDAIGRHAPDDAIIVTDAGNFGSWVHRHFAFKPSHRLLGMVSGAMGFGAPAAVAAALRYPDRQVIAVIGDGGYLMTGYELATGIAEGTKVRLIVSNNKSYGTIRLHQEKWFPGRKKATDLVNPDFAALGRAFGAKGLTIDASADADAVVAEALATDGPVVVDVRSSLDHINANTTLTKLAAAAAAE